jgi:hypothetical protein
MESAKSKIVKKSTAAEIEELKKRITRMEDIDAIKKLQNAYGYYLEHWQEDEIVQLFSHHPDVSVEINGTGFYKGWEAIKKSYVFADHYTAYGGAKTPPPEYLHILMPIAGIVDVNPDGKTAKGRWYGFFMGAMPRPVKTRALIGCTIWENQFIKEDGIWRFFKLFASDVLCSPVDEGWVKTPYIANTRKTVKPSSAAHFAPYPSGYIFPYHYKNPGSGE